MLCDLGIKYLTKVYNGDWLKENNIDVVATDTDGDESDDGNNVK